MLLIVGGIGLHAQPADSTETPDTLRGYTLGRVVVTAEREREAVVGTTQTLSIAEIRNSDAPTLDRLASRFASTHVQTNTRGESYIYMRNAGERQVSLYLDGALLNTPWDGRIDMNLVPVNAVGSIRVSRGAASVLYGPNTLGGVVEMTTRELSAPGVLNTVDLIAGENGYLNAIGTHTASVGTLDYLLAIGHMQRDATPLPDLDKLQSRPEIPFDRNQGSTTDRTNSDIRISTGYLRVIERIEGVGAVGISSSVIDAEKGVPPAGHIGRARFWRFPRWRVSSASINGDLKLDRAGVWNLGASIWQTTSDQTIDQFGDSTYTTLSRQQQDLDIGAGGRAVVTWHPADSISLALAASFGGGSHEQVNVRNDGTSLIQSPKLRYRQTMSSAGLEYTHRLPRLVVNAGVGYDVMTTPETGGAPSPGSFQSPNIAVGARWDLAEGWSLRSTAGWKSRFPAMRELFDESLGSFITNPELDPEMAVLADLGLGYSHSARDRSLDLNLLLTGFYNRTSDAIEVIFVQGDSLGRQTRINLPGSRTYGLELEARTRLWERLTISGNATWENSRGIGGANGDSLFLRDQSM